MDEYPVVHVPQDEILEEEEFERLYSASTEIIVLLSVFYVGISIVAVIGNTLVIWVVATTRQMRTVTNMYIANLAFADVFIGLFCIPFQFQAALLQRWNLPWFMCGFCPFVQTVSVNVSVFTLTAIAIDRHRAIINPLRARPTKFICKIIISGIWLFALTFAIPCAIAFRVELEHERFKEDDIIYNVTRPFCMNKNLSESQLQTYRYTLVFVQYLVPFCVISFVYIQMAVKLWGTRAPGNAQDSRDITLLKNKKKVIKMLIIVVIVFGLCWLPLQLYNILYVTIPEINEYHFISIVWFVCDWLAMSNSCYNPFIYGIYNEKFKREFNKRFAACFCKFKTSLDSHERTVSMHTRASSVRSTYANSSMRIRNNIFSSGQPKFSTSATMGITLNLSHAMPHTTLNGSAGSYRQKFGKNHFDNTGNHGSNGNSGGLYIYQWQRNSFKPLQPDVIESEADDDGAKVSFMELRSCSPYSEANTAEKGELTKSSSHESSSCICQQELGSRTECDGTCILSEVSRVQGPVMSTTSTPSEGVAAQRAAMVEVQTAATTKTTATTATTTSSSERQPCAPFLWHSGNFYATGNNNNLKLDFNFTDCPPEFELREYVPLTSHLGSGGGQRLSSQT